MSVKTNFMVFLYMPPDQIAKQLQNGNDITFLPTYQAWEGLGIFGLGFEECRIRQLLRPSSILIQGNRHRDGQDFATAALTDSMGGKDPSQLSIRLNNTERRRILGMINESHTTGASKSARIEGIKLEIFSDPSYYYQSLVPSETEQNQKKSIF